MRVLCDENVPNPIAQRLVTVSAIEVFTVETELGMGANDYEVRDFAERNDCVVLTNDKGFLQTRYSDGHGLLYYHQNPTPKPDAVARAIEKITVFYADHEDIFETVPGGWV